MSNKSLSRILPLIIVLAILLQLFTAVSNNPVYLYSKVDIGRSYIDEISYSGEITAIDNSNKYGTPRISKTHSLLVFVPAATFACIGTYPIINLMNKFDVRNSIFSLIPSYFNGSKYKGSTLSFI